MELSDEEYYRYLIDESDNDTCPYCKNWLDDKDYFYQMCSRCGWDINALDKEEPFDYDFVL